MSHECENCGGYISDDFYRVVYPRDQDVIICPQCPGVTKSSFEKTLIEAINEGV